MAHDEAENEKNAERPSVKDDASAAAKDVETSAGEMFRNESFADMIRESTKKVSKENEPLVLDFGGKGDKGDGVEKPAREKDPFAEFQRELQERREKEQKENIDKIVDSLSKDGKFPDNIKDMLRDFEPRSYAGFHGDAQGLKQFVDAINKKLGESGSQYSLDVSQMEQFADPRRGGFGGGAYQSWTANTVSVRDGRNGGRVTDSVTVNTDPIAKPGIKF